MLTNFPTDCISRWSLGHIIATKSLLSGDTAIAALPTGKFLTLAFNLVPRVVELRSGTFRSPLRNLRAIIMTTKMLEIKTLGGELQ
jgi:hypothetical protein